jgi:hypothetical protein
VKLANIGSQGEIKFEQRWELGTAAGRKLRKMYVQIKL